MGLKLFITGTAGYLGGVLASRLAEMPEVESITGVDNAEHRSTFPAKVNLVKMDVRAPEIADAMSGHDYVIHSASIVLWLAKMPEKVRDDINFNGTRNVAKAAVKNRVRGFLQASSISAYAAAPGHAEKFVGEDYPIGKGDSGWYYGDSKAIAERILTEILVPANIPLTLFRMPFIIGPRNTATVPGFRQGAFLFRGAKSCTQFIHEDDVAAAFALALRTPLVGAYNVAPDDSISMEEFYRIIGTEPKTIPVWLAVMVTNIRWRFFGSATHSSWVGASMGEFTQSNAKLKAAGWIPRYTCVEAVKSAM